MLNLNKVGRPLARIDGGKYSGRVVSVSDQFASNAKEGDDGLIKEFRQLKIANDSKFQHIPDTTKERSIFYITGPSGSGKSTYTRKYLEQYKKKFKNRPIYLFSSLPTDESLDKIKPKRFKLNEALHEDPIKVAELAESMCIFDDIDVISNKKIREAVYDILNQILEIGRHYKIACICTNHLPTNGRETRRILNEAHTITYFPHSAGGKIKYLLEEYVGLDRKQMAYIKKTAIESLHHFQKLSPVLCWNARSGCWIWSRTKRFRRRSKIRKRKRRRSKKRRGGRRGRG